MLRGCTVRYPAAGGFQSPHVIPIPHIEYNIANACHCEGVKPEAISAVRDCFVPRIGSGVLAMTFEKGFFSNLLVRHFISTVTFSDTTNNTSPPLAGGDEGEGDPGSDHPLLPSPVEGEGLSRL